MAHSFQHRRETDALEKSFTGGTAPSGTVMLTGMGGVGKTQLAAQYANAAWTDGNLDVLIWVNANTRSSIISAYAQAGVELCSGDPDDISHAARAFLAWLTPKGRIDLCRWLIILDDVSSPSDLRGLWPPAAKNGRTLVTTRRRDSAFRGDRRKIAKVGLFRKNEAISYLESSLAAGNRRETVDELGRLVCDLGHLPLALSQAAAYIVDADLDCATYRAKLADRARRLEELVPDTDALPDDQNVTLAAAWSLSIERADNLSPAGLARPVLQLTSFLDANGIPESVLTSSLALNYLSELRNDSPQFATKQAEAVSRNEAVAALRVLHRLNLIDHSSGGSDTAIRVHQLIQRATRDHLSHQAYDKTAYAAADALVAAWPDIELNSTLSQVLRANAFALTYLAEEAFYRAGAAHYLQFHLGKSIGETGQAKAAVKYFRDFTDSASRQLGSQHPSTLTAQASLGMWLGESGDPRGAAEILAISLDGMHAIFGADHAHTLATQGNLAHYLSQTGDLEVARAAFEDLLDHITRVAGPDDPEVLTVRNNLASLQGESGDAVSAAIAFGELLSDRQRILGRDHPDTLSTRMNLASWQGGSGDTAGAVSQFFELVSDMTRVLGADHPDTLITRGNLALWLGNSGDVPRAISSFTELVEDMTRVFGPDHPHTLTTRGNLANWQRQSGDKSGATLALSKLLEEMKASLGPGHPNIEVIEHALAAWRIEDSHYSG
ncbi:tetratricopeptide repeat protein [Streptomyces massasporeus]|uniref:tetratricopeptide repeat protein n=1 Tax=Streptomyces massasporeus TaxID=67324 RepID=UPI003400D19D